ncbi:hypothetical protein VMCG_06294 [Cytospora schulzeri]|uniref:Uncharacterized protein n=1 Tax=Cytospora schulzeri TaxID=448051 RepID=A0A423W9B4_9PEZI|nr:hypothetical protein VMCG_06294 [Valsa malicola]
MWLLHVTSKHLKAFLPDSIPTPGYAILSHTWDPDPDNEVLFSDFEASGGNRAILPSARLKRSWRKVELACGQALGDGYAWIWIDTCCIDKSSSSELSEAINSMYAWYRDSGVCYAWLSDLSAGVGLELSKSEFQASRWFTRGWTLQELLAPQKVVFFIKQNEGPDRYEGKETVPGEDGPGAAPNAPGTTMWLSVGEKTDFSELISSVTGIDASILRDPRLLETASIAQRMSWASKRATSRPEDMAYCLMGIFDVNMPMLYGEGAEKAFLRLQEEIMKSSDDQSLFAWRDDQAGPRSRHGLLATSPRPFRDSDLIIPYQNWASRPPYAMTNRGLQITLPEMVQLSPRDGNRYLAVLDCPVPPNYNDHCFLTIYLEKLTGPSQFARVLANQFGHPSRHSPPAAQQIFVRQQQRRGYNAGFLPRHALQLRRFVFNKGTYRVMDLGLPHGVLEVKAVGDSSSTIWGPFGQTHFPPYAYVIARIPSPQVVTAFLLERAEDGEQLVVRIGSAGSDKVGFDAFDDLLGRPWGEDYYRRPLCDNSFAPRPSGSSLELKYHLVNVDFSDSAVHGDTKYIMVDVQVTATNFSKPS